LSVPATPVPPPLDERGRELERKKERRRIWLLVGGVLTLVSVFVVFLFLGINHMMGSAEPVQAALREVNQCLPCRKAMGTPIERGWFFQGQVNWSGTGGNARLKMPVNGPRGYGSLFVHSLRKDGEWSFIHLILEVPEKELSIVLWRDGENVTPTGDHLALAQPPVFSAL